MLTVSTEGAALSMLSASTSAPGHPARHPAGGTHEQDSARRSDDRRRPARDGGIPHRRADQPAVEDAAVAAGRLGDAPDAPGAGRAPRARSARPPDVHQRAHGPHRAVLALHRGPRPLLPLPRPRTPPRLAGGQPAGPGPRPRRPPPRTPRPRSV